MYWEGNNIIYGIYLIQLRIKLQKIPTSDSGSGNLVEGIEGKYDVTWETFREVRLF